ncbi:site-specific integrase [Martelella mediterranea]|uniref:Phage integrase family protein n=1 Tax=Martelella mediterranea TaxID=293089 RepID=A0A4R3NPP3_9HYPH|nr:site-specific integrase [Martelella mediterranea]TCT37119.1 phage integrase family protein [Martelella mediterranea]
MGTITARKQRRNGKVSYTAQIRIKRNGKTVHSESQTFDRKKLAVAWMNKREGDLYEPGGLDRAKHGHVTLSDVIEQYLRENAAPIGRTKAQVLRSLKTFEIADMACDAITSIDIVSLARELSLDKKPQTVANYLSHLASIFAIARPAWGHPLDKQAMQDGLTVAKRMGLTSKSRQRDRRPSLGELDKLLSHFEQRHRQTPQSMPMAEILLFALFSTRRQDEICRIVWQDLDTRHSRVLVRDMKNPGQKIGNDNWCDLPAPAMKVIERAPRKDKRIFPYSPDAISSSFTKACRLLGIDDLHFHDLRHEGVSRLFEVGYNIPHAAAVSGHRSWVSLKRYSHIRQTGDKYEGWAWLPQ